MNRKIAIEVRNLAKAYKLYAQPIDRLKESLHPFGKIYHKDFYALKNISFEIPKGETVGIIGRNGSGKSTLLKIITGVLTPSGGRVNVHGKISAILELGAGFNPEMSGLENIYLNNSINGLSRAETDGKIDDILEFADLGDFIEQPLKTYSSGMRARLAFAVAINIDPDILIVDEALAVGDAAFQRKCFARMEQIREAGATILFVSHSAESIVSLCSRAIWLSNGEKIIEGSPKLVTGLYMKNSNKKYINRQEVQKELEELEKNSDRKEVEKKEHTVRQKRHREEFYDSSLKPKSTIFYEEKGAKIGDVKVTTMDGDKVNVLVHGREYRYTYKIKLDATSEDVRFGFLIKNIQGVPIAGGSYSLVEQEGKNSIKNGHYTVSWIFKCLLSEGNYSFNAGLSSRKRHLHRIVDAYMIRVMPIEKKIFTASVNIVKSVSWKTND